MKKNKLYYVQELNFVPIYVEDFHGDWGGGLSISFPHPM